MRPTTGGTGGTQNGRFQVREEHCVIADLVGKGKHIRTVPVPLWAKRAVDEWTGAAAITGGTIFRRVSRLDKIWGDGITPKAIWHVVKAAAKRADIKNLAPHDLRRTCARLCHLAGGELEQIQLLLGHASVQTTERYLRSLQRQGTARQISTFRTIWVSAAILRISWRTASRNEIINGPKMIPN